MNIFKAIFIFFLCTLEFIWEFTIKLLKFKLIKKWEIKACYRYYADRGFYDTVFHYMFKDDD